jgi:hypothetical protein
MFKDLSIISKMTLSLKKLCKILKKKNFVPTRYYSSEGNCIFIQMISLITGVSCMLYINSKFEIPIGEDENVTEIEYYDMEDDPESYDQDAVKSPEEQYPEVVVKPSENVSAKEHLTDKYKRSITITSGAKKNLPALKGLVRQLERLQLCVNGLPYHLTIIQDGYLGFIRDGETDTYVFKNMSGLCPRSLNVATTLPEFYEKGDEINDEISQISKGIRKILDKNLSGHAEYLRDLVQRHGNLNTFTLLVQNRKDQYYQMIEKYEKLLAQLIAQEEKIKQEYQQTELIIGEGIDKDLQRSQLRNQIELRLTDCASLKKAVLDQLSHLNHGLESISMATDRILFDNSVMMDKVFKNFDKLIEICK